MIKKTTDELNMETRRFAYTSICLHDLLKLFQRRFTSLYKFIQVIGETLLTSLFTFFSHQHTTVKGLNRGVISKVACE